MNICTFNRRHHMSNVLVRFALEFLEKILCNNNNSMDSGRIITSMQMANEMLFEYFYLEMLKMLLVQYPTQFCVEISAPHPQHPILSTPSSAPHPQHRPAQVNGGLYITRVAFQSLVLPYKHHHINITM